MVRKKKNKKPTMQETEEENNMNGEAESTFTKLVPEPRVTKLCGMDHSETTTALDSASLLSSAQRVGRSWTPVFLKPGKGSRV